MRPVVVIGDALLDVDVEGSTERLCPDAPVPVLDVATERARPGGAALAAVLLAAAGVPVTLVTALDGGVDGRALRALLGAGVRLVTGPAVGGTAVKTRMLAGGRPLLRADRGDGRPGPGFGEAVTPGLRDALAGAGAVLVSDYGRGVTSDARVRAAVAAAVAGGVPAVWDPHPHGAEPVAGTTVVTPNLAEARAVTGGPSSAPTVPAALATAAAVLERWDCRAAAVTVGERGAVVAHRHGARSAAPAPQVTGGDTCGAGDAFAAQVAALLAAGRTVDDAVQAAVAAAAGFVAAGGAAGVAARLAGAAGTRGATDVPGAAAGPGAAGASGTVGPGAPASADGGLAAARALVAAVQERGGTAVASGGCFDLLHTGHSRTLAAARALGDCLVVLLNSDASVSALKGPDRPIVPAADRAEMLLALGCVDAVVVFDGEDPCAALAELRPDLWVKGGDYDPAELPETALMRSWGGEVTTVAYRPGRSTTRMAQQAARR